MSRVRSRDAAFFGLYDRGEVSPDEIDDFVEAWHENGDPRAKTLELHEYLGLNRDEYEIWMCDSRSLPLILQARRSTVPLTDVMRNRLDALLATGHPSDGTTIFCLRNWLDRRERSRP